MKERNRHTGHINAFKALIIKHGDPWKDKRDRVYARLKDKAGNPAGTIVRVVK